MSLKGLFLCFAKDKRTSVLEKKALRLGAQVITKETLPSATTHALVIVAKSYRQAMNMDLPQEVLEKASKVSFDWIAECSDSTAPSQELYRLVASDGVKRGIDSASESAAKRGKIDSFFISTSKDLEESSIEFDAHLEGSAVVVIPRGFSASRSRIAGFDLDHTLICTKSGKKFPETESDWKFLFSKKVLMEKLKDLVQDGFTIAVFSNQNGVEKGKQTTDSLIAKFKDIGKSLCEHQIPICFFASTHEDLNRKPNIGLWRTLCRTLSIDFDESLKDSFYVGDAAGRITGWSKGKKKDFSDSDRKFALNLKIPFFTPEEYFLGEQSAKFVLSGFDPFTFSPEESNLPVTSDVQEIVVFVGFPGSGKTFLFRDVFAPANYEHVNRDSLKSLGKCQKLAIEALKSGKSVVIDNTNPSRSSRAEWIKLSQQFHVPVRCIYFDISRDLAEHLNKIRFKLYPEIVKVPALAYNVYAKNFEMPQLSEGFTQIRQVKFSLRSKDPDFEKLFFSYS